MSIYVPSEEQSPNVLVIGAMAADAKGQPRQVLAPGGSTRDLPSFFGTTLNVHADVQGGG